MSRCIILLFVLFSLPLVRGEEPTQLSATVVDVSGAAISGATVQILNANGTVQLTTHSDATGAFTISWTLAR